MDGFVRFFDFIIHSWMLQLFVCFYAIKAFVFWIISKPRNEKKWNKIFYQAVEVSEDSHLDPSFVWSFLIDPKKFMNFNYKNKIKWIKFDQPLKLGSEVKIRIRKGSVFKGFISFFDPESRIVFEYHVFPNATRFICDIEMIQLENKTRYILRMKGKKLLIPLVKKLYPKLSERMANFSLGMLRKSLKICEDIASEQDNPKIISSFSEVIDIGVLEKN